MCKKYSSHTLNYVFQTRMNVDLILVLVHQLIFNLIDNLPSNSEKSINQSKGFS